MSKLYERFHKQAKKQHRIISDSNFTYAEIIPILNKYKLSKRHILDIGCGAGAIDFYLAKRNNFVTGIDISKKAINACRRDAKKLNVSDKTKFYASNIEKINIKSKFYVILALEIIEHIENDDRLIKTIFKALKQKGLLILSTPSICAPLYKIGFLDKFDKRVGHLRRYSKKNLTNKIKNAGFKIIEVKNNEGILRNLLFTTKLGSVILRVINKLNLGKAFTLMDKISIVFFGESDYIVVAKKA